MLNDRPDKAPPQPPLELTFPSPTVAPAVADSLHQALTMPFSPDNHEEGPTSLDESAYEILSETTALTSDDEGQDDNPESLVSFNVHTPDDVSSLADSEEMNNDCAVASDEEDALPNEASDSGLTTRDNVQSFSPIASPDVSSSTPRGAFPMLVSMRTFDQPHMPEVLRGYGSPRICVTVQQGVEPSEMMVPRPFRILYVGDTSRQVKHRIISKIASALVIGAYRRQDAPFQPTRLNAVPITAPRTADTRPEVELFESLGVELCVDDCMDAYRNNDAITLVLNHHSHVTFRLALRKENQVHLPDQFEPPHLAVFVHTTPTNQPSGDIPATDEHWFAHVRDVLNACSVPRIELSTSSLFHHKPTGFFPADLDLQLRVESYDLKGGSKVVDVLPVDVASFIDMSSDHLIGHLVYLTAPKDHSSELSMVRRFARRFKDSIRSCARLGSGKTNKGSQEPLIWKHYIIGLLFLMTSLLICLASSGVILGPLFGQEGALSRYEEAHHTAPLDIALDALVGTGTFIPSSARDNVTPLASLPDGTKTLGSISERVSAIHIQAVGVRSTTSLQKAPSFPDFELHKVGCCHMLVTPHKLSTSSNRNHRISIEIFRGSEDIETKLSNLRKGIYAVELDEDQSYGHIMVILRSPSNPEWKQSFEVDLGPRSSSLKGRLWHEALNIASKQAKGISGKIWSELEAEFQQIPATIHSFVRMAGENLEHSFETGKELLRRSHVASESMGKTILRSTSSHFEKLRAATEAITNLQLPRSDMLPLRDFTSLSHHLRSGIQDTSRAIQSSLKLLIPQYQKPESVGKSVLRARRQALALWKRMEKVFIRADAPDCTKSKCSVDPRTLTKLNKRTVTQERLRL